MKDLIKFFNILNDECITEMSVSEFRYQFEDEEEVHMYFEMKGYDSMSIDVNYKNKWFGIDEIFESI